MDSKVNTEIKERITAMLKEDKHDIYVHEVSGENVVVDDLAVIFCYYGIDNARLDATMKAFELFNQYKAIPAEVIVVESQYSEEDAQVKKLAEKAGFKYLFIKRKPNSEGLYIREALLNAGVRTTSTQKIVAIDSDIGFCNPYWAKNVSLFLDECDMTQPFGLVYFAQNGEYKQQRDGLEPSNTRSYVKDHDKRLVNNAGLGFAFKRWLFDAISGFDVISSPGDDQWLWQKLFEVDRYRISLLPYVNYLDGVYNKQCTRAVMKSCNEICFHIEHTDIIGRRYAAYVYACARQSTYPLWDVEYDVEKDEMPEWKADDEPWIQIRKDTINLIAQLSPDLVENAAIAKSSAKKVIDEVNLKTFGNIPDRRKLKVITNLTYINTIEDVIMHQKLVKNMLGEDVEYICITDKDIHDVRTMKPTVKNKLMQMIDAFREDIAGKNDICLYMSLGAIPVEKIEICNVPHGFIGMSNPRYSNPTSELWKLYGNDTVLFSGDFSFIYDSYMDNSTFNQSQMFIDPCQCIAYNLYAKNIKIRNICQFIDVQYMQHEKPEPYEDYVAGVAKNVEDNKYCNASIAIGTGFGTRIFPLK